MPLLMPTLAMGRSAMKERLFSLAWKSELSSSTDSG
jgi:hypothetical protein